MTTLEAARKLRVCLLMRGHAKASAEVHSTCTLLRAKLGDSHPKLADALLNDINLERYQLRMNFLSKTLSFFKVRRQVWEAIDIYRNAEVDEGRLADAYMCLAAVWGRSLGLIGLAVYYPVTFWLRKAVKLYKRAGSSNYKNMKSKAQFFTTMSLCLPFIMASYVAVFYYAMISSVFCWLPVWFIWISAFLLPMGAIAFALVLVILIKYLLEVCCGCALMDGRKC